VSVVRACILSMSGKRIRTKRLDRNDGAGRQVALGKDLTRNCERILPFGVSFPESKMKAILMMVTNILGEQSLHAHAFCIPTLWLALPPLILGKSRMRRSARTDLDGGDQ
jgi:hypothetical protein